ncbi:MAG: hypothetical protein OEM81_03740 [Acidimicrobiia bacterium]|nr:hypothetical protein [Acidimicrobiia bacterium]MDH3396925.1 hypothetical protein [Acidimicrobiia bacterium]MDH5614923.1 hypothetical protein [Acidimicrobiia bacterium]
MDRLQDVARDVWADPIVAASAAAQAILRMLDGHWNSPQAEAVRELRRRRADSPFILAVTKTVLDSEPNAGRAALLVVMEQLDDRTWADEIGSRIAHHGTLGVVSLGETTLAVLEAARDLGGASAALFTDQRAIARGLTYLGMMVEVAPPEEAEAVLLPVAALMGSRMWTTVRAADVALRTSLLEGEVVVVSHPLASLSARNRADFRPAPTLIDVKI